MFDGVVYALLAVILVLIAYPLLYVVSCSLSDPARILTNDIILFPKGFNVESYVSVIKENRLTGGYVNTIVYTVVGTAINISLTATGAYALSCRKLKGRGVFTKFILFTMLFSGGLIPTYLVVSELELLDTLWALILPSAVSTYNLVLMRNFFQSVPDSLYEAATIEGETLVGYLLHILLPLFHRLPLL